MRYQFIVSVVHQLFQIILDTSKRSNHRSLMARRQVVDGSKLFFSKTHLEYTCLPLTSIAMRSRSIFTKYP